MENGVLFLGKAEIQLTRSTLFRPIDTRHQIFQKMAQEFRRSPGVRPLLGHEPR